MKFKMENDTFLLADGSVLSADDFHHRYTICAGCGEAAEYEDTIYSSSDENYYCPECARRKRLRQCTHCGEFYFSSDGIFAMDTDRFFCNDCASEHLSRCYQCGDYYESEDNLCYDEDSDENYCQECYDNLDSQYEFHIRDYHTFKNSGAIVFYGDESREDSVHLGFELEVDKGEDREECAEHLYDIFDDFCHYERDGSLDDGFEIISQPASISFYIGIEESLKRAWNLCTERYGFSSHNATTCGLHIHIDSRYFGSALDTAQAKFLFLFERHWDNLVRFSRRTESQLHWCNRYGSNVKLTDVMKAKKQHNLDRYYALNISSGNHDNFEIRLWRGTLNPLTFMATLKFTARLAKLVKETPAAVLAKMSFEDLLGDDEQILAYWKTRQLNFERSAA